MHNVLGMISHYTSPAHPVQSLGPCDYATPLNRFIPTSRLRTSDSLRIGYTQLESSARAHDWLQHGMAAKAGGPTSELQDAARPWKRTST
eukprot:4088663-Pleurochrysis_carterae.AAC.6